MSNSPLATPQGNALVAQLYDAALDAQRWSDAVASLTAWLGGAIGCLQVRRLSPSLGVSTVTTGIDPVFYQSYLDYYHKVDPHLARVGQLRVGCTHLSREVLPDDELFRTQYFNEYIRPQGLADLQGTALIREPTRIVTFATFSPYRHRFDAQSRARLDALVPHLMRAAALTLRAEDDGVACHAASLMAVSSSGLLRVSESLHVLDASPGVLDWLPGIDCRLTVRDGNLASHVPAETDELRASVRAAIAGTSVTLRLDAGRERLSLFITPAQPSLLHPEPAAFVFFSHHPTSLPRSTARPALPPALQRVADALAAGLSDKEIAVQLGLTLSTARTYVSRVLHKRGVRSRRELMLDR